MKKSIPCLQVSTSVWFLSFPMADNDSNRNKDQSRTALNKRNLFGFMQKNSRKQNSENRCHKAKNCHSGYRIISVSYTHLDVYKRQSDICTLNPRDFQKVVQNGIVSQKDKTLGIPMVTDCSGKISSAGYSLNNNSSRVRNRFGIWWTACSFSRSFSRTSVSRGSPRISPRSQRLFVTQDFPLEKVTIVRLQ